MLSIVGERLFDTVEVMSRIGCSKRTLLIYRQKKYVAPRMVSGRSGRPAPYYSEQEIARIEAIYNTNKDYMRRKRPGLLREEP